MTGKVAQRVLELLDHVIRQDEGWTARCPAHEDQHPSLSVTQGDDGRVLLYCHAGCSTEAIVAALRLELGDLFEKPAAGAKAAGRAEATPGLTLAQLAKAKGLPEDFLRSLGCTDGPGPSVKIPYHDADGNVISVRYRMALRDKRFRWRKGDRLIAYGLNRLAEARAAGWILLVEGESDCWTLWYHGIPALGIPGKATWREEWASFLAGLDVYLWQEPDAEDLGARIAKDLSDVRIIVAPPDTKDISDANVRGDDVGALIERLRLAASPVIELLAKRADHRLRAAHRQAEAVLAHPDPLELVETEIRAQGYGGDVRVPQLGYLAFTTRVLTPRRGSMPAHALFTGPSSGGKNAAMSAGLRLLPEDAVHVIDAGSPRVLIYDDAPLEHRVVVFSEADSLPAGEDNPAASAIRNLLQDGHLHYQVTVRDATTGKFTVHSVDKPGPSVLATTSVRPLGTQLMTRLFTIEVPDEPDQLRAALAAQAALELDGAPPRDEALIAFQSYLQAQAPIDVVVPFARELATYLGRQPTAPRVLRDYPRLLSLIKAAAVLRIAHREHDGRGRLVATIADYLTVFDLVHEAYAASSGASERVRNAVAGVAELAASTGAGATVSVSELAGRLEVSVPSAWRRARAAIAGGWLANDETRKGQTAKLRVGEPLPSSSSLPSPEELAGLCQSVSPENVKTDPSTGVGLGTSVVHPTANEPEIVAEIPQSRDDENESDVFTFSAATGGNPVADGWVDAPRPSEDGERWLQSGLWDQS